MENKPSYLFCLSSGYSLKLWDQKGLIDREILLIKRLTIDFNVTIFSYGKYRDEKKILNRFNIKANLVALNYSGKFQVLYSVLYTFFYLKKIKYNVVRSNQFSGSWVPSVYKQFLNKNCFFILRNGYNYNSHVISKSNNLFRLVFNLFQKKIVSNSDLIICTSEADVVYFSNLGGKNVIKIYNSVNLDIFKFKDRDNDNYEFDFLIISKFSHQKNLINTLRILGETNKSVLLIGDGSDSTIKDNINDLINKYSNIKHLKKVDNFKIPDLMNRCNTFVNLAYYEGNPKAVIEAFACGLKLILSNIPAHLEMKDCFGSRAFFIDLNELENERSFNPLSMIQILDKQIDTKINTYPFNFEFNYMREYSNIKYK